MKQELGLFDSAEDAAKAYEQKDFFELYGTELVCIRDWISEPKFTVEELYAAFKARLESEGWA